MSAPVVVQQMVAVQQAVQQTVASFVLHALWQAPLLVAATSLAIRIGRPHARVAHLFWILTLVCCVALPFVATVAARRAALEAQPGEVSIRYDVSSYSGVLPALQREPAWKRVLHRHLSLRDGVRPFAVSLSPRAARVVAMVYVALLLLCAVRLVIAWSRARRLVRRAATDPAGEPLATRLAHHCRRAGVAAPPAYLSREIAGPALAGVVRPALLLPRAGAMEMTATETDAVLAHEIAHLRRGDPWVHAACSALLLPVCFHPAALWAASRVRQTREMACDAEAVECVGSAAAYARALLQVAERAGRGRVRFAGLGLFTAGRYTGLELRGTGLELFGADGAMEERMQKILETTGSKAGRQVVPRAVAGASLVAAAVAVAAMLQVQPALAGERAAQPAMQTQAVAPVAATAQDDTQDVGPRLLGGDHARAQLQHARHQLAQAQRSATTDEDRNRLATAQEVLAVAEQQLAAASGRTSPGLIQPGEPHVAPEVYVDLSGLKALDTTKMQADIDRQLAYVHSPAFQAEVKRAQALGQEYMKAQTERMNSPEFRAEMQRALTVNTERMQAQLKAQAERMNSPEFQEQMKRAQTIDTAKIQAMLEQGQRQREAALRQMQSAEAAGLIARNELPLVVPATRDADRQDAGKPLHVDGRVMAANALQKKMPVYPAEAKEKKIRGEVVLHALIDDTGKVEQLSVVSSPDASLSKSATDAVRDWVYKPYLLNGRPTPVDTTISVHYSLEQ